MNLLTTGSNFLNLGLVVSIVGYVVTSWWAPARARKAPLKSQAETRESQDQSKSA